MRSIHTCFIYLAICAVLAKAGPLPHKHNNEGHEHQQHGEATSYTIVTKHEDNNGGHDDQHNGSNYHLGEQDDHIGHGHGDADDYHTYPKYEFVYGVEDLKTGDIKQQWESRDGDKVKGSYSLKESDGTTRVVQYTSDKKKGFEATVHKIGQVYDVHKEADHADYHSY
ncbi:uncharacterized protein [Musca autumnalis]|uniref:uncharacterized protein n=1 Tax=Musca autumnalis TaxID=221902 RepID=UPI003CEFD78C